MKKRLLLISILIMLLLVTGCASYTEHSKKFSDTIGTWDLDCIYVDTKPIEFEAQSLTINEDNTGLLEYEVVIAETTDDEGNVITPQKTDIKQSNITFSSDEAGLMTVSSPDNGTVNYEFSVDNPAQLLHMYETKDGALYHYVYSNILIDETYQKTEILDENEAETDGEVSDAEETDGADVGETSDQSADDTVEE